MLNRDYKNFGPGEYSHVYNRGNEKKDIFLDDDDYSFFLYRLEQNLFPDRTHKHRTAPLPAGSFTLISYCLMPNHFHLLIRQNSDIPVTKLILRVCTSYSMYFNKKYGRVGHLFQDRYKLASVDTNDYLLWLTAYIHQNPKVGGLVEVLSDYKWSSYSEYISGNNFLCDDKIILSQFERSQLNSSKPVDYKKFVDSSYEIIKQRKDIHDLLLDHIS